MLRGGLGPEPGSGVLRSGDRGAQAGDLLAQHTLITDGETEPLVGCVF